MIGAFTGMRAGRSAARTGDAATVKASVVSEINEARILASLRKYLYSVRKAIFWNFRRLVLKSTIPIDFPASTPHRPKKFGELFNPSLPHYSDTSKKSGAVAGAASWLFGLAAPNA